MEVTAESVICLVHHCIGYANATYYTFLLDVRGYPHLKTPFIDNDILSILRDLTSKPEEIN
jgi:hypothetical protein